MFQGSIPTSAQQIVLSIVKEWTCSDVYIGCSGNFTVERTLDALKKFNIHGNDVTVYSCILGRYFSGQPLRARYNEEYEGPMTFVKNYMKDDLGILTVSMILSGMGLYLNSKPNPYYEKMINAYAKQWDRLYAETRSKFEKQEKFLSSFYAGDVLEYYKKIPKEEGFISFPPFWTSGYEKMFKALGEIIDIDLPKYDLLSPEKIHEWANDVTDRENYVFMLPERYEEFDDNLRGECVTTLHGKPMYIYSKSPKSRIVLPNQTLDYSFIPKIGEDEDIGEEIGLMELKLPVFNSLRSMYLNPAISPASPSAAYGVMVDRKMVGVFAVSSSPTLANWDKHLDTPSIYLMTDFPVAPSKYKRLSKLIVMVVLSKESQFLYEKISNKRIRSVVTTAFSDNPVSMKYRGILELLSRKENGEGYNGATYSLNYGAPCGQWTLKEAFDEWKSKHGKVIK